MRPGCSGFSPALASCCSCSAAMSVTRILSELMLPPTAQGVLVNSFIAVYGPTAAYQSHGRGHPLEGVSKRRDIFAFLSPARLGRRHNGTGIYECLWLPPLRREPKPMAWNCRCFTSDRERVQFENIAFLSNRVGTYGHVRGSRRRRVESLLLVRLVRFRDWDVMVGKEKTNGCPIIPPSLLDSMPHPGRRLVSGLLACSSSPAAPWILPRRISTWQATGCNRRPRGQKCHHLAMRLPHIMMLAGSRTLSPL